LPARRPFEISHPFAQHIDIAPLRVLHLGIGHKRRVSLKRETSCVTSQAASEIMTRRRLDEAVASLVTQAGLESDIP